MSGSVSSFGEWLAQLSFDKLFELIVVLLSVTVCLTVHECCHGLAAYLMGDDTAKRAGRLTLNPLKHISVSGFIMLAVCHFGWAKPVPVDMRRFRYPKWGMAATALAGPLSNVLLAFLALLIWLLLMLAAPGSLLKGFGVYCSLFLQYTAALSCGLAVFNIFPIPPLDGSKVLFSLLPEKLYRILMRYERCGMLVLVVVLVTGVLDRPLNELSDGLLQGLLNGAFASASAAVKLFS